MQDDGLPTQCLSRWQHVKFGLVDVFTLQKRGFSAVEDLPLLEHLTHDDLDMLIVDLHALKTIDVLHLVDHVVCQRFDTHDVTGCHAALGCRP